MGVSYHIVGVKPADETFKQMKAIWDACENAGVTIPGEVIEFFEGEAPDNTGVTVDLTRQEHKWQNEYQSGFQVDLKTLDPSITMLRFVISH